MILLGFRTTLINDFILFTKLAHVQLKICQQDTNQMHKPSDKERGKSKLSILKAINSKIISQPKH